VSEHSDRSSLVAEAPIVYLATLQFSWGGLFDSKPADEAIHLIRGARRGTPGPTLCGIDRFVKGGPGWSVGGGVTGPMHTHKACAVCQEQAQGDFDGLPIAGMFAHLFAGATYRSAWDVPGLWR
jgi:hypothetical protein